MARWYRQDGNADSNPKMIRAGFWGRVAFHALCRVSADHELGGVVPAQYTDPEYLADRLRLAGDPDLAPLWSGGDSPVEAMKRGVTRTVSSGLTEKGPDGLILVGWEERNGDGDGKSTERVRRYREKKRLEALLQAPSNVSRNEETLRNTRTDGRTDDTDGVQGGSAPAADAAPQRKRAGTAARKAAAIAKGEVQPSDVGARVLARIGELGGVRSRHCQQLEDLVAAGVDERALLAVVEFKARDAFFVGKGNLNPVTLFRPSNFPGYLDTARSAQSPGEPRPAEADGYTRW